MAEFNEESGQIISPGYPNQYENLLDCQYRITVGPNYIIKIDFENFDTEEENDWIELYDGNSTNATSLGKFSGYFITIIIILMYYTVELHQIVLPLHQMREKIARHNLKLIFSMLALGIFDQVLFRVATERM